MKCKHLVYEAVILVDDDPIINFVHQRIVEKSVVAKKIKAFTNPEKALEYLHQELCKPKNNILLLLDINMPEMTGFEFLDSASMFSKNGNMLDILIVTSSICSAEMGKGLKNSLVSRYLTKPLTSTDILSYVKTQSLLSA